MPVRAVLFDMDGVLIRTEEIWAKTLEDAGRKFRSGSPVTREEFAPTFGQGTEADVRVFGLDCTPDELDAFYQAAFEGHSGAVWIDPDAVGVLASLRRRGLKLAVVTNTVRRLAERLLGPAGILDLVDDLSCADMVQRPKPAPDLVLHALGALGAAASEAWFIGDSRFDRAASEAAGTQFIGYQFEAPRCVTRLTDLEPLLDRDEPASPR
jgi:HAD superfamily hydrolase (TIGR01509 family)